MSDINQPPSDNIVTEPESAANSDTPPIYPYNNVQQSKSGHTIEMDDTPERERVRIQHGTSNTFIEMHPNGDNVCKIYGDGYEIIAGAKNVIVSGVCNITINGDSNINVKGNKTEVIEGDYNLQVLGNMTARCLGSNGMQLFSDSNMRIASNSDTGGAMYLSAGDHVYIASDLQVAGAIHGDTIGAESRINAGTGVYAGPLGIYSEGLITSLVSLNAPIANIPVEASIGLMSATWMTDSVNTGAYNHHQHPVPHGMSGTPTIPMN